MNIKKLKDIKVKAERLGEWESIDLDTKSISEDMTWLVKTIENQQAELETLSMAHDAIHRELPKDKHTLIKNIIELNRRVQELEEDNEDIRWLCADTSIKLQESDKRVERYREALDYIRNWKSKPHEKYINHLKAVADDALEGDSDE